MRGAISDGTMQHRQMPGLDAARPVWMGLCAIGALLIAVWFIPTGHHVVMEALTRFFSEIGNVAFLVIGYGALLMANLYKRAWGSVRVILTTLFLVTLVVHLQKFGFGAWLARPSGSAGGFPSGHAAAACALAFLIALYFPRYLIIGYGMAVAISWSRVPMSAHWLYQVAVGSITGYVLALLCTDHLARYSWQHRLAQVWQSIIIVIIPLVAIGYRQHEYENDAVLIIGAMVPILIGMLLRLWQYWQRSHSPQADTAMTVRRRHRLRHLANTLICTGVTFGAELVWLVPVELLICLAVHILAERAYQAQSTASPRGRTEDVPSMGSSNLALKRPDISRLRRYSWVREAAWGLLIVLPVIKEFIL
ncbi:MAG TPA: phosphatase PAP2 family protein [Armatimonadota bacterium]|nr:phosphatase PAP2 family protein [Armatimonadota bacterium]